MSDPAETLTFGEQFLLSSGFAGIMAVAAAVLALAGVAVSVYFQRRAHLREQWWLRTRWALDHTLDETSSHARELGIAAAGVLVTSKYAGKHEKELISDSLTALLNAYARQ